MTGTIVRIRHDHGYGLIAPSDGGADVFFHRNDLTDELEFDERLRELRVEFETFKTDKGMRARDVRPAA